MANPSERIIDARSLVKRFDTRTVMDNLSFEVRRGEILVILGPSGCGKSTLLRCLIGLQPPDAGVVRVLGADIYAASAEEVDAVRRRIGMTFQDGALFGSLTLAENIEVPLIEFSNLAASTRRILAKIKLGMVGLAEAADSYPAQISGGMRKRAALARAMALDPELLFFDEPSSGLDPVTSASLDQLLIRINRAFSSTLIVVTHELESAFAIADRIFLMDHGRIVISGDPQSLKQTDDPVARRFLGREPQATSSTMLMRSLLEDAGAHRSAKAT